MDIALLHPARTRVLDAGLVVRPAAPDDQARVQALVRGLSPRSRYLRFFNGIRELSPAWLEHFTRAAPQGEYTLLALMPQPEGLIPVGMAQYAADPHPARAEFAVVVDDTWQGLGIGRRLVQDLSAVAATAGFERLEGSVLADNQQMLRLMRSIGFDVRRDPESGLYLRVSTRLASSRAPTTLH